MIGQEIGPTVGPRKNPEYQKNARCHLATYGGTGSFGIFGPYLNFGWRLGQSKQCGPKVPCFLLAQAVGPKTGWPVVSDRGQLRGVMFLSKTGGGAGVQS